MKRFMDEKISFIVSMVIFGTIGLLRRYIPYPSSVIALVRGGVGALFLLGIHFLKKERFSKDEIKGNLGLLLASGVLLGANWICLFEAYRYTSVAVATVCYYMAPVFVILLSPVIFKEKLTLKKGVCAAVAVSGMVLVSGLMDVEISGLQGVLFGLVAAMMYAAVVILNKFIHGLSASERTFLQLAISAVAILPYVLVTEDVASLPVTGTILIFLGIAGVLYTGVAYALYFGSIKGLPAQTVALYSYIDPIVAVLVSALVLHEPMSGYAICGTVLVIGAMLVSEIEVKKKPKEI